ncbi:MAG: hypothetical protein WCS20_08495, partial [Alphaproteobacteria bacterium]
ALGGARNSHIATLGEPGSRFLMLKVGVKASDNSVRTLIVRMQLLPHGVLAVRRTYPICLKSPSAPQFCCDNHRFPPSPAAPRVRETTLLRASEPFSIESVPCQAINSMTDLA